MSERVDLASIRASIFGSADIKAYPETWKQIIALLRDRDEQEQRAEALAAENAALRDVIDNVLLKDGHFVFCTGGLQPQHGCMPTCIALRKALAANPQAAPGSIGVSRGVVDAPPARLALSDEEWGSLGIEPDAPAPAERGPFGVIRSDDSQGLPQ